MWKQGLLAADRAERGRRIARRSGSSSTPTAVAKTTSKRTKRLDGCVFS